MTKIEKCPACGEDFGVATDVDEDGDLVAVFGHRGITRRAIIIIAISDEHEDWFWAMVDNRVETILRATGCAASAA